MNLIRRKENSLDLHKCNIDFIANGKACTVYGGRLDAVSPVDIDGMEWYQSFRKRLLASIGNSYMPVYRLGDGELRFLLGRQIDWNNKNLLRELGAQGVAHLPRQFRPWQTSWGEQYPSHLERRLKRQLADDVEQIARDGIIAPLSVCSANRLHGAYMAAWWKWVESRQMHVTASNLVPFHFIGQLFTDNTFQAALACRSVLVVSGLGDDERQRCLQNLTSRGVSSVSFINVSTTQSYLDVINLCEVSQAPDLCLVAAGIGAAGIARQLRDAKCPVIDIGGLLRCLYEPGFVAHGLFSLSACPVANV